MDKRSNFNLKVVLLSNNEYGEGLNNLSGANLITERLYNYFIKNIVSNPKEDIMMLNDVTNTDATNKLYNFIDNHISSNNVFLFYFCGHGNVSSNNPYELLLALKDTTNKNADSIGLNFKDFVKNCKRKEVKRAIYIIDCCNSGLIHTLGLENKDGTVFISSVKGTTKEFEIEIDQQKIPCFSYYLYTALSQIGEFNKSWYSIEDVFKNIQKNVKGINPQITSRQELEKEKFFPDINQVFDMNNLLEVIDWRITSRCNNNCKVCYACNDKNDIKNLKQEDINIILEKLTHFNCKSICVSGGEPTYSDYFIKILQKLHQNGFSIFLSTNGYKYLDYREDIEEYIDKLSLPIDGYEEDNTVNGRNEESFLCVKKILDYYKIHKPPFPIKISTVLTSKTDKRDHLKKIFDFLKSYNIAIWKIYEFIPENRGIEYKNEFMSLVWQKNDVNHWISDVSKEKDCNFKIEFVRRDKRNAAYFIIQPNGEVIIPVEGDEYVNEMNIGNILYDDVKVLIKKWGQYVDKDNYIFNVRLRKIMQTYFLDDIDKKILFEICSKNDFPSLNYLSKALHIDSVHIKEHLDELYEHRIIKKVIPIINLKVFGIKTFLATLRLLEYINYPKGYLEDYLCYNAHIGWVTECEHNVYRIAIFEKEMKDAIKILEKMQLDLYYRFDYEINELNCSYNLDERKLFTSVLNKSTSTSKYNSNEKNVLKEIKLTPNEFYILKQIEELRKPSIENIDDKIFLDNINVFENINSLLEKGIIDRLSILLDTRLVGYDWYVIFVHLPDNQKDDFINFLKKSSSNVTHINHMVSNKSDWNFDFEVHTLSDAELDELIDQIQINFNASITTEKRKIIKECKFSFLTHYVLDVIKTGFLMKDKEELIADENFNSCKS